MKVILLAAGFGTRLRPLTETIPKCLVPIKGKPLLEIWLEKLTKIGLSNFLINTHYLSDKVSSFIETCPQREMCTLKHEVKLLGTAGTLLSNLEFIGKDDCILIHADNYCLADIEELILAHKNRPTNCLMTMLTFRTNKPSTCGIVEVDYNNIVIGFHEKIANPPGNLANGAVYILSNELIKTIKKKFNFATDFSNEIIPQLKNKILSHETSDIFIDIGTLESYFEANNL